MGLGENSTSLEAQSPLQQDNGTTRLMLDGIMRAEAATSHVNGIADW